MTRKRQPVSFFQPLSLFRWRHMLISVIPAISDAKVDMSQIELKAEHLYDKEKVDLETIVIDDVFKLLQCTEEGLTEEEAKRRYEIFGPNRLESEEQNAFLQVSSLSLYISRVYPFLT